MRRAFSMRHIILALALSGLSAIPAAAQQLKLEFNQPLVTVDAASVPVRTILNEWATRGGTKVVGSERISGAPLTLKLVDVPEAKALEVILRSVAGYMVAPRSTGQGASIYDRILVMATSTPPPAVAAAPRPGTSNTYGTAGTQRFVPQQRQADNDDDADSDEDDPNPPQPPAFTVPGATGQPGQFQPPNQQQMQPMIVNPQGQTITITPNVPTNYPTTTPFGGGAPGSINVPAPQPGQPVVVTRPPGRQQQ